MQKLQSPEIFYKIPCLTESIFQKIKSAQANLIYSTSVETSILNSKILFDSIVPGHFLTNEIATQIKKTITTKNIISITSNDKSSNITVFTTSKAKLSQKWINSLAEIFLIFYELRGLISYQSNLPKITIYMLDLPKRLNFQAEMKSQVPYHFNTNTINSGYHGIHSGEIVLYRSEEILKVLLHELIHFHKLDRYQLDSLGLPIKIASSIISHYSLPLDGEYIWNESKTESLAILLHHILQFSSLASVKHKMRLEINWSLFQIAKILMLVSKEKYLHKIFKGIAIGNHLAKLHQSTCIFNYFILKTLLLLQDDNLLKKHNLARYQSMFQNDKILTKGIKYYLVILSNQLEKGKMQTRKNKQTLKNSQHIPSHILDSMRMSSNFVENLTE